MVKIKLNPEIKKDYLRLETRNKYLVVENRYSDFSVEDSVLLKEKFGNNILIDGEKYSEYTKAEGIVKTEDVIETKVEEAKPPIQKKKKRKFKIF